MAKVAIAMSVYFSDTLEFVKLSIESLLQQEFIDFKIFIMVDGDVTADVKCFLTEQANNTKIDITFFDNNKGLAFRLNQIIEHVITLDEFDYIARMDADDVCESTRLKEQVAFLDENSNISIVGSDVLEIDSEGRALFYKKMDYSHQIMENKIIKKCPFNHPSVMFRTKVFSENALRYKNELMNTQDYYLWVDALKLGLKFGNINKPLLKFRVDKNFHSRRGLKKALNDFNARCYAFKTLKCYSFSNVVYLFLLILLRLSPSFIKKTAYRFIRGFI